MTANRIEIRPQRWERRLVETVHGGLFYCEVCGHVGEEYFSTDGAQRAGVEHVRSEHPEVGTLEIALVTSDSGLVEADDIVDAVIHSAVCDSATCKGECDR